MMKRSRVALLCIVILIVSYFGYYLISFRLIDGYGYAYRNEVPFGYWTVGEPDVEYSEGLTLRTDMTLHLWNGMSFEAHSTEGYDLTVFRLRLGPIPLGTVEDFGGLL